MVIGNPTKLNLIPSGVMPVIYISQDDAGYDKEFLIYSGDIPYNIPSGVSVTIRGTKADGLGVTETATFTTDSNLVTVAITEQMVAAAGQNVYELVFVDTNGLRVASINMVWMVKPDALGGSVISESDLDYATHVMNELQSVAAFKNQLDANTDGLATETNERITADETLQGNINVESSARSSRDALLQSEIDQLVAPTGTAPSAAEIENARIGADSSVYTTLGDAIRTPVTDFNKVLEKNFGVNFGTLIDAYNEANAYNSVIAGSPNVYYKSISYCLVTALKLDVSRAGTLSVGYYTGEALGGGEFDSTKMVVVDVLTFSSTGVKMAPLPTPVFVPKGASFFIGNTTDTAQFKYGNSGIDKGFFTVNYSGDTPVFTGHTSSIGISVFGYTCSTFIDNNDIYVSGYDAENQTSSTFGTAPFVLEKDFDNDFFVTDIKGSFRDVGSVTLGTVKKSDVVVDGEFDYTKINIQCLFTVTTVGVQTIHLSTPVKVTTDDYIFVGLKSDTAKMYYGTKGRDKGFFYVNNSGIYKASTASVNVNIYGSTNVAESVKSNYAGKRLSILGDSISTFAGYIPEGNATYYPAGTVQSVQDTWWYKLITMLGMAIEVNNSWSGSRVTTTSSEESAGCMTRCQNLGTNPDVIIVWMGINDFNNEVVLGTYDGLSDLPTATTTFREAYAIMLNKILTAYPMSEVWVCTLPQCERNAETGFPERNGNGVAITTYNKAIKELADAFGVKVLDHAACGLTYQNMSVYNPDQLHPNRLGHLLVANNDVRQMDGAVRTMY